MSNNDNNKSVEFKLLENFWNHGNRRSLVFLVGSVGTGKTTLLHAYLKHWCPKQSPPDKSPDKKLYVIIDLKGLRREESAKNRSVSRIREAIRHRCESQGYMIVSKILQESGIAFDSDQWPDEAMRHIRKEAKSGGEVPFEWLVIAFDNCDQASLEVQQHILEKIKDWNERPDSVHPYRVYVTLWPQTLESYQAHFGMPLSNLEHEVVHLADLDAEKVFALRLKNVSLKLNAAEDVDFVGIDQFLEEFAKEGGDRKLAVNQFAENLGTAFIEKLLRRVLGLANGNMRVVFRWFQNLLDNRFIYEKWCAGPRDSTVWSNYDLVDGAITGSLNYDGALSCLVPNVFACCGNKPLLALHLLDIVQTRDGILESLLLSWLQLLGYSKDEIGEVISAFSDGECQLWYRTWGDRNQPKIICYTHAIERMMEFSLSPVMIDNAAMATAVPVSYLDGMKQTSPRVEDFPARVETSLSFIAFLEREESRFIDRLVQLANKAPDDNGIQNLLTQHVRIPNLTQRIKWRYRERMQKLSTGYSFRGASKDWWQNIFSRLVLDPEAGCNSYYYFEEFFRRKQGDAKK
jgi:hypothetical protein